MKLIKAILLFGLLFSNLVFSYAQSTISPVRTFNSLKDAFKDSFYMGAALNLDQIWGRNEAALRVVEKHFNSVVAENCMKSMYLQPREGEFNFRDADKFVEFAENNGMHIVGHALIWHEQAPSWFFVDQDGKDVSKEVLIERMRKHIYAVVSRYKGRVRGWDVVNEAMLDNGDWRKSKFYEIIGEEYIALAFQFAYEADPQAELYYNDFSTAVPAKREGISRMVQQLLQKGVKVSAIGMQEHNGLDHPSLMEVERSILRFAELGVQVMVTELEISVLPYVHPNTGADLQKTETYKQELNPYEAGLPLAIMEKLGQRYVDFFRLYLKHQDKIARVTLWGVGDADSWKNNWPIPGRKDYPLLFDRNYQPKPFLKDIVDLVK